MPRSLLAIAVLTLSALVHPAPAQNDPLAGFDDPAGQLNRLLPRVSDDKRADLILGRALSETEPVPDALEALDQVSLLVPGDGEWDAALAWATGEKQKAALEAFVTATDRRADNVFALPYGEAAPADLRAAGFWVELPDDRVYEASLAYLDLLGRLDALVWIEANRLAEAGEGMQAAELMTSMVRLGRMLADRPMYAEAAEGYAVMLQSCERLRDLVYRHRELLDTGDTKRIVRLLEDRTLRLDRLLFPNGREIAVKQAIRDHYEGMGEPDAQAIAALAVAADIPVEGGAHAGYFEAVDVASRVFADWRLRWSLNPYDIVMDRPSYYTSLYADPDRHALVLAVAQPHDVLFELRMRLRAELAGTKLSLGVVAYGNDFGSWPKPIVAIRPAYVREIDVDPYDPLEADQMRYFVPIRDQSWGAHETRHPHTIRVHHALDGSDRLGLASSPGLRRISDAEVVESMRPFTGNVTRRGLSAANLRTTLEGMNEDALRNLMPAHMRDLSSGLDVDALRVLVDVIVGATLVTPEFKTLTDAWGEEPDTGDRRRRGRSRRSAEPSRELVSMARVFAVVLSEVGAPMARRLHREQEGDPNVAMFDVVLDEDDFVVYSIGIDSSFDWAEESGLDGSDILFWPPVLSLYREHAGG